MNSTVNKVENPANLLRAPLRKSVEPPAVSLVEVIQTRVATALGVAPALVRIDNHHVGPSGWILQSFGDAVGTRFFAKIFIVDPYPIVHRYANPWDELPGPKEPYRRVEEQVNVEWNMALEMRGLTGDWNIPIPLGRSIKDRILVFEEVSGLRLDRIVNWKFPYGQKSRSMETAMLQAGKWLRTIHDSSMQGLATIDLGEIRCALQHLIRIKEIEATNYARQALRVLDSACRELLPRTSLRVPVALNHGDFSLPNLMWNCELKRLWVVDFELSDRRPILHDLCSMIFDLRRPLLFPLTSENAVRRYETAFWEGYGPVPEDLFVLVNALASCRLFYHTLPRLRTWREQRGLWAGVKASVYTQVFEPVLVQRVLKLSSVSKDKGKSQCKHPIALIRTSINKGQ